MRLFIFLGLVFCTLVSLAGKNDSVSVLIKGKVSIKKETGTTPYNSNFEIRKDGQTLAVVYTHKDGSFEISVTLPANDQVFDVYFGKSRYNKSYMEIDCQSKSEGLEFILKPGQFRSWRHHISGRFLYCGGCPSF